MSLGGVFNGSIMTEIIFGYPGVGTLIADLIYPFIDPRIRYS